MKRTFFVVLLWAVLCVLVCVALGCGPDKENVQISGTPASRGTDGTLQIIPRPEYGNARVRVELQHVPPPNRLAARARVYIVWARQNSLLARVGVLDFDAESREARFEGTVYGGRFELVVTAEAGIDASAPSTAVLLDRHLMGHGE